MILFVSGRTDIVAFYSKWFMKRYKEGYVDVRNPFNPKLVSRIDFKNVDAIFFCTKNPLPILPYLKEINKPIIFHVTITPYHKDIEPNIPDKKLIIDAIKKLSSIIGIDNLYIRYDPIFLNQKYNLKYHQQAFAKLCYLLKGYVKNIIVSFLDDYQNVRRNWQVLQPEKFTEEIYQELGLSFSAIASSYNMTVQTCFEDRNLCEYGFIKRDCLSAELAYKLTGKTYKKQTARKGQKCNCVQMVDIGVYNSCKHYCKYCYANYDEIKVENNFKNHNSNSSLLIGKITDEDIIKERIK